MALRSVARANQRGKRAAEDAYTVGSVARAMALLRAFDQPPYQFGVSALARVTGQTKNLVFRLLHTLEAAGFVLRVEGGEYAIGMRLFELARFAIDSQEALRQAAHPFLEQLTRQTGESSNLIVLDGLRGICADFVESDFVVRDMLAVGRGLPLHAGGSPRALLAFLPVGVQDAVIAAGLPRYTPRTVSDADQLRRELVVTRDQGFWVAFEEVTPGADAVGVPVFDASGAAIAGLGIAGPATRMRERLSDPQQRDGLVGPVREAAAALSHRLGYRRVS